MVETLASGSMKICKFIPKQSAKLDFAKSKQERRSRFSGASPTTYPRYIRKGILNSSDNRKRRSNKSCYKRPSSRLLNWSCSCVKSVLACSDSKLLLMFWGTKGSAWRPIPARQRLKSYQFEKLHTTALYINIYIYIYIHIYIYIYIYLQIQNTNMNFLSLHKLHYIDCTPVTFIHPALTYNIIIV